MGGSKGLLLEVINAVDLDEEAELVQALGVLASKWADMAGEVEDIGSALALVRAIADGTANASVKRAFEMVGAEDSLTILQEGAGRLKSLLDRIPQSLLTLLEPIGKFDEQSTGTADQGLVRWPLLDKSLSTPPGGTEGAAYALSLGASAALTIEAGDTWPYSDPMPRPLLRMRAEGSLSPRASATLPFSAGAVTATASASASCILEYYFAVADQSSIYALAAGKRLGRLVDPFDFDSVWDGFAASDLAGVTYQFGGSVAASVSVAVADATTLGAGIKADLGATVSVGFKLDGQYFLTFRAGPRGADGEPRIIAALSRQRSTAAELGAKLGVTVDLSSVAQKVHAVLAGALGEWDEVLQQITPYLSPGTLLQGKAESLIEKEAKALVKDEALRAALVRDLRGVIGIGTPSEPALAEWLSGQLAGALDAAQDWVRENSDAAISLLDNLGRSLPALAQPNIRGTLEGTADKLIASARDELEAKVEELFARNSAELGKALERVGAAGAKAVKSADDALEGVRAVIARYDALFRKIVAATEDAARAKISAAIQVEESRISATTIEIEGTFLARSEGARDIFRALTQGDFNTLLKLIDAGGSHPGFALNPERSSLKRYSGLASRLGMDLVLFGFGVSGSELLSAEADVLVDGTGKVQVDARAKLQKRFKALDAEREIELVSSFSLVGARKLDQAAAPPAADRSLGLAITVGHIDDGLKRREVERFVESLLEADLIEESALTLAKDTFTRWIGNPGSNDKLSGALQLKLALDRKSLSHLLGLGTAPMPGALSDGRGREILLIAFERMREREATDREAIDGTIAFLRRKFPNRSLEDLLVERHRTRKALRDTAGGPTAALVAAEHRPFAAAMNLSWGMRDMVEQLRQIYFSTPQERPDSDPLTWSASDYRDAQRDTVRAVRGWLQLNTDMFWTNSKVHPRTIAFLETVAQLAGLEIAGALSLTMTRHISPETIVLVEAPH